MSNSDGYTVKRVVSFRRNARETPTEVKALGRSKIIEILEIFSPLPPRSRKPVHQDLVYVFRLLYIYFLLRTNLKYANRKILILLFLYTMHLFSPIHIYTMHK